MGPIGPLLSPPYDVLAVECDGPKCKLALPLESPHLLPVIDANLKCEKDHEHTYATLKYEIHHAYDEKLVVEQDDMPHVLSF